MEREIRRRFSDNNISKKLNGSDNQHRMLTQILTGINKIHDAVKRVETSLAANGQHAISSALNSDVESEIALPPCEPSKNSLCSEQGPTQDSSWNTQTKDMAKVVTLPTSALNTQDVGQLSPGCMHRQISPTTCILRMPNEATLKDEKLPLSGGRCPNDRSDQPQRRSERSNPSRISFMTASGDVSESLQAAWEGKLGPLWPTNVALRSGLEGIATVDGERIIQAISQGGKLLMETNGFTPEPASRLPLEPNSLFMTRFETVKFVVLSYDLFMSPFLACWDLAVSGWLLLLAVLVAVFWTFELGLNFMVGYYDKGELIMAWGKIMRRFLTHGFAKSLILVLADWFVIYVDVYIHPNEFTETFITAAHTCRLVELMRIYDIIKTTDRISKRSLSPSTLVLSQMLKIPLALLIYNHIVSCIWGWLGRKAPTQGVRWLERNVYEHSLEEGTYADLADLHQYTVALHWALAQMTPGPMALHAGNEVERAFNCLILMCGLLFGSMIVSQFSSIIMQLTLLQRESMQKLDKVRKFLMQRKLRPSLAQRVQKQVTRRLTEEVPLQVHDVPAFELLPSALRDELLREVRVPHLLSHPIFSLWARIDRRGFFSFSQHGVNLAFLPPPEVLFEPLHDGREAYMVMSGRLLYVQEPPTSWEFSKEEVKGGVWLCEACLWSCWVHVGRAEVAAAAELLVVSSDSLVEEFSRDHPACHLMKHYARSFHQRILSAVPPFARWPNDLSVPFTDVSDLLGPHVGIGILQSALGSGSITLTKEAELELVGELLEEKCALTTLKDGTLQRLVSVIALKVMDYEGNILAELGKCDGRGIRKAGCVLPGGKRAMSEVPSTALKRVIERRLPGLQDLLVLEGTEKLVETKTSGNFGMTSTYTKLLHLATVNRPIVAFGWHQAGVMPDSEHQLPAEIEEVIYVMDSKGGWLLYGWLPQAHFDVLSTEDGRAALQRWIETLSCDYAFDVDL